MKLRKIKWSTFRAWKEWLKISRLRIWISYCCLAIIPRYYLYLFLRHNHSSVTLQLNEDNTNTHFFVWQHLFILNFMNNTKVSTKILLHMLRSTRILHFISILEHWNTANDGKWACQNSARMHCKLNWIKIPKK